MAFGLYAMAGPAAAAIAYVQGNSGTPSSGSSVSVIYTSAQAVGDLNVVFVGWEQASSGVQSITDTNGNTYVTAIGPTVNPSGATQLIYYAKNISAAASGTNTVTVTFNNSVPYPDVRILEFSGISTDNPFDVAIGSIGTGTTLNSGALTTTTSNDLLVAGGFVQHSYTGGAGAGYTQVIVSQWNLVEDAVVSATGSYSATSTSSSGYWIMHQVAFRAANAAGDSLAPTAPAGLTATAVSSSQINLSWTASTDDVGVTGYLIERCPGANCSNFAQIASSSATTYQDTGLSNSSTYTYRIRASDGAGNLSGYSSTAGNTTLAGNPAFVQGNSGSPNSGAAVSVTYTAAQTAGHLNVVFVGWDQANSGVQSITDTTGNTYVAAIGPTVNSSGATQVVYYAKNILAAAAGTNTVTVTFNSSVTYPDVRILEFGGIVTSNPFDVGVAAVGSGTTLDSGSLTTTSSNELLVAGGYVQHKYSGGAGPSYTQILVSQWNLVEDAIASTIGSYNATSTDSSGYWVMQLLAFKALLSDATPPSVPTGLTAQANSSTQIDLSWSVSTDDVGISGYRLERCQGGGCTNFALIATPTTTSYSDTGLTASTPYTYRVLARDTGGNLSNYSNTVTAATQSSSGGPDTTPPTIPSGLTAAPASGTQITLSWLPSTDAVGVTGYVIERCMGVSCVSFAQIATSTTTNYADSGLTVASNYSYRVLATDAAGNLSGYSSIASSSTPAAGSVCD